MTKDEVKKLRMNSPESLQFLNNATKFYNLMMMYRCAIREINKLEVLMMNFQLRTIEIYFFYKNGPINDKLSWDMNNRKYTDISPWQAFE